VSQLKTAEDLTADWEITRSIECELWRVQSIEQDQRRKRRRNESPAKILLSMHRVYID